MHQDYQAEDFLLPANLSSAELETLINKSLDSDSAAHKLIQHQARLFKEETESLWLDVKAIIDAKVK